MFISAHPLGDHDHDHDHHICDHHEDQRCAPLSAPLWAQLQIYRHCSAPQTSSCNPEHEHYEGDGDNHDEDGDDNRDDNGDDNNQCAANLFV